jgi:hypothetical protein
MKNLAMAKPVRAGPRPSEKSLNLPANKASVFQRIQRLLDEQQEIGIVKLALGLVLD